ncbi:hypothetical protein ASF72_00260 [Arthrobacter sp. Leaf141]|uniref:YegP family protein n=1 Tax=Arthrobacter sp. Leaf141 TaxID=1736273 RepID=UPI0006F35B18|nr:YegP family protein [Arthrobacter sp. Leaf141]KQR04880.1 hypothetical protein ASF72_00260 [Arthrobacter sp. Leaf141]
MAGNFEVFVDPESMYRFRLLAADGTVMAVSGAFADKPAVAAGIAAVRECAGTGLVTDLSRRPTAPQVPALPVETPRPAVDTARALRGHVFRVALGPGAPARKPRWIVAAAR